MFSSLTPFLKLELKPPISLLNLLHSCMVRGVFHDTSPVMELIGRFADAFFPAVFHHSLLAWIQFAPPKFGRYTPQKSNIDTEHGHILKESTFSKPSFRVSMLVFGHVLLVSGGSG